MNKIEMYFRQYVLFTTDFDSLIVSGNEATLAARLSELLAAGLDELMVTLVPIKDAVDELS
jgi:hypothetical protein